MALLRRLLGPRGKQFALFLIEVVSLSWISIHRRLRSPHVTAQQGEITVYGFFESASGLGAAARGLVSAISEWNPRCRSISLLSPSQRVAFQPEQPWQSNAPLSAHSIHVYNPDVFAALMFRVGPSVVTRSDRNLAIINWETDCLPPRWKMILMAYESLAAPSTFSARAVRRATGRPVSVIPNCVPVRPERRRESRSTHFQFLVLFDALSSCYRKNPVGAVRAFRQALGSLPEGRTASMIIKCHTGTTHETLGILRRACDGLPIQTVAATFTDEEMQQLWESTDCLINLHRSEGFGLPVAEALARGIPVITTKQGGVLDFTDENTAFLVSGSPIPKDETDGLYHECSGWLEPDIAAAAAAITEVVQQYDGAVSRALCGRVHVGQRLSRSAVKAAVSRALEYEPLSE